MLSQYPESRRKSTKYKWFNFRNVRTSRRNTPFKSDV